MFDIQATLNFLSELGQRRKNGKVHLGVAGVGTHQALNPDRCQIFDWATHLTLNFRPFIASKTELCAACVNDVASNVRSKLYSVIDACGMPD